MFWLLYWRLFSCTAINSQAAFLCAASAAHFLIYGGGTMENNDLFDETDKAMLKELEQIIKRENSSYEEDLQDTRRVFEKYRKILAD